MKHLVFAVVFLVAACGQTGAEWLLVDTGASEKILAAHGTSSNDIYAVGEKGVIRHWNGTQWAQVSSPTDKSLQSVFAVTPTDVWVGGFQLLLRGNAISGFQMETDAPKDDFRRLYSFNAQNVYLTSCNEDYCLYNNWYLSDGTQFTKLNSEVAPSSMSGSASAGIWMVSKGDVYRIVGQDLVPVNTGFDTNFDYVSAYSATDVWVGNTDTLLHFDGMTWSRVELADITGLKTIHAVGPSQAWLGGSYGKIAFTDGVNTTLMAQGDNDTSSVYVTNFFSKTPNDVWAFASDSYGKSYILRRFVSQ